MESLSNTVDPVNHPPHYTAHPSGVECIQITEHMGFNLGTFQTLYEAIQARRKAEKAYKEKHGLI
jgi:hypothetical protein